MPQELMRQQVTSDAVMIDFMDVGIIHVDVPGNEPRPLRRGNGKSVERGSRWQLRWAGRVTSTVLLGRTLV